MKCWPAKYCLELANRIKQLQMESVIIGRPDQSFVVGMLFRYNSIYQRPFDNLICLKTPECLEKCLISELKGEFHLPLGYSTSDDFYQRSYWQTWHCHEEEIDKRCMAQISVDTVFNAAKDLMDREVKPIK
ncbi:MAG: hypothetical protein KIT34_10375 [Cyanobacteria bacterium TGS_CYA1]|nr:hypothetical protein [Cyanobacteria bacterium TGS_CYA1]